MTSTILIENPARELISKDEQKIREVIAGLHRAHYVKDAEAVAAPYATDATIFDLAPPLVHHGVNVQEKRAWFDSWETPIEIVPRDLAITVSGDFAFAHCLLHMSGKKKGPRASSTSGCAKPCVSSGSVEAGGSCMSTPRCRSTWMAHSVPPSICSRECHGRGRVSAPVTMAGEQEWKRKASIPIAAGIR